MEQLFGSMSWTPRRPVAGQCGVASSASNMAVVGLRVVPAVCDNIVILTYLHIIKINSYINVSQHVHTGCIVMNDSASSFR